MFDGVALLAGGIVGGIRALGAKLAGEAVVTAGADATGTAVARSVGSSAGSSIEQVAVGDLVPTHGVSRKAVARLAADIEQNGIKEPLKYVEHNGTKYIVDGNTRIRAAARVGLETVPAERVSLPYKGYRTIENVLEYTR